MLDLIQMLLSFQIFGFCVFGGLTLLLRAGDNRAKRFLGWSMFLWAFLTGIRLSVNLHIQDQKETFNPDVLLSGSLVMASLGSYVIEVLRPGYLTLKRFIIYVIPVFLSGIAYLSYRLSGGTIHVYYSVYDVYAQIDTDVCLRTLAFIVTLVYMILPIYLVLRYSKEFPVFLRENVSDPEDYDLEWLRKIMIILSIMYAFYIVLLLTDSTALYVTNKLTILIAWYYIFYKALFLKVIPLEHTFQKGWDIPYDSLDNDDEHTDSSKQYAEAVHAWFEKEKPYLREDLRLIDLQRVFPISRSYLSKLFNQELGCSFSDYVNSFRVEESKRLLEAEPTASIQDIAERSGFHSISTFRRAFIKHTGIIPSEYKKNNNTLVF